MDWSEHHLPRLSTQSATAKTAMIAMTTRSTACHCCARKPSSENALTPPPWSWQLSSFALPRVEVFDHCTDGQDDERRSYQHQSELHV